MTRSAIITDTHIGKRNNSVFFHNKFERFFDEVFFPELEKNNVKRIYHLGDVFDNRTSINLYSYTRSKRYFFDKLKDYEVFMIPGNHDCYYRDRIDLNFLSNFLSDLNYDFKIIDEPKKIGDILMVPWICKDNLEECLKTIRSSNAKACFGHFEINGFPMDGGGICDFGLEKNVFRKYSMVLSGHFHNISQKGSIRYIGSPYAMTWGEYESEHGFYLFDDETFEIDFIENPIKIFKKIEVNEDTDIGSLDLEDTFVKVVPVERTKKIEKKIEEIKAKSSAKTDVIEEEIEYKLTDTDITFEEIDSYIKEYVARTDIDDGQKEKVLNILITAYQESNANL